MATKRSALQRFRDLVLGRPVVDVVSNNPRVQASARARATLPQAQRLIQEARRVQPDLSFQSGNIGFVENVEDELRRLPITVPQRIRFPEPVRRKVSQIKAPVVRVPLQVGGFLAQEVARAPFRVSSGALGLAGAGSAKLGGRDVRPQEFLADIGTIGEGAVDLVTGGAVGATAKLPLKGAIKQGLKTGAKLGAVTGAAVGLQEGRDEEILNQILSAGTGAVAGTVLGAGIGGAIAPIGAVIGKTVKVSKKFANAVNKSAKSSFLLQSTAKKGQFKVVRRARNTQFGDKGEFKSQAGFVNLGEGIEGARDTGRQVLQGARKLVSQDVSRVSPLKTSKLLTAKGKPTLNTAQSRQTSLGHGVALKSDRLPATGATTELPRAVVGQPPQPPRSINLPSSDSVPSSFIKSSVNKVHNLYTQAIDRFHPITRLARKAGEATGFKQKVGQKSTVRDALTAHYGTGSTATHHVDFELSPLLKRHNANDIREAAVAFRDLELAGRGIKGSRGQTKANQALSNLEQKLGAEEFSKLKRTLQELYSYQDNLVQEYMVKTGIMTPEQFASMKEANQFYVPFKRVMDTVDEMLGLPTKQVGSVSSQDVIKGIKGSERELVDPIESILENTYKIVGLGNRQKVAGSLVNLADSLPEGVIRRLDPTEVIGRKNTISLFQDGRTVRYEVPREIEEAAKGLNEEQMAMIVKIMSVPTQIFRASATGINPEFLIPNVSRDLQSAVVNAGLNPLRWVKGLASTIGKDDLFQEFLKAGGKTSRVSIDKPVLKKTVREITGKGITAKRPSDLLRLAQIGGEWSEQATRVANFDQVMNRSLKQGFSQEEALARAAYAAQEGTVNFARRGSMTKNVNALVAFLNARVQGTDRLIRSIKDNPVGAGARLGITVLTPALATRAWNEQFQSFNDERIVSDRTKQFNYIVMLSEEPIPQLGGAQYIKVPKGEIGAFSNIIDEFINFTLDKGGDVAQAMGETLKALSPIDKLSDVIPTVLKPPIEVGQNKSFFTGFDIVPEWKQSFPKGFQDSSFTSPLFRMIGQNVNQSPAKLQHLAEGYGTGLVRIAEQVAQPFVPEEFVTAKNERGADIQRIPVARRLFGGASKSELQQAKSNKSRIGFLNKEISTVRNAVSKGDVDEQRGSAQIQELQGQIEELVPQADITGVNKELNEVLGEKAEPGTLFETAKQEKEKFKKVKELTDLNLSDDLLRTELDKLGVTEQEASTFAVASESFDLRLAFVRDQVSELGDIPRDELMDELAEFRRKTGGKQIMTNSIIDDLFDLELITKEEKKFLKSVDFIDGEFKIKPSTVKAKKKKKLPKIKVSRGRRIAPVQRQVFKATKVPKISLKSIQPLSQPTRAKLINKTVSVDEFKKLLLKKR